MSVTVFKALTLNSLRGTRVLAGYAGLENPIRSVSVMEVPDIERWVREGDLLLTTVYPIKDDPRAQETLVPRLAKQGLSGLAIKPSRYIDQVPDAMIEAADQCNFPLLELPAHVSFNDIIIELLTEILEHRAEQLKRSEEINRRFTEIVLQGGGLQEIADTLAELLKTPVTIHNLESELLATSCRPDMIGNLGMKPGDFERGVSALAENNSLPWLLRQPTWRRMRVGEMMVEHFVHPIIVEGRNLGYLCAWEISHEVAPDHQIILNHAATVTALQFMKEEAVKEVECRFRNDFLNNLLGGYLESMEAIVERGRLYGWDLTKPYVLLLANIDNQESYYSSEGFMEDSFWRLKNRLLSIIERVVTTTYPDAIITDKSDGIVIFMPVRSSWGENEVKQRAKEMAQRIVDHIQKEVDGVSISIGIGRYYSEPVKWKKAYREARQALQIVNSLGTGGEVIHYDDLGVYRILATFKDKKELEIFCEETIGPLVQYDQEHDSNLLITLETYLQTNGNLKETAKNLFIHYNTLRYRLERIEGLTGKSLADAEDYLSFHVAVKIYRLLNTGQTLLGKTE